VRKRKGNISHNQHSQQKTFDETFIWKLETLVEVRGKLQNWGNQQTKTKDKWGK
jgi:hypothetical protein